MMLQVRSGVLRVGHDCRPLEPAPQHHQGGQSGDRSYRGAGPGVRGAVKGRVGQQHPECLLQRLLAVGIAFAVLGSLFLTLGRQPAVATPTDVMDVAD